MPINREPTVNVGKVCQIPLRSLFSCLYSVSVFQSIIFSTFHIKSVIGLQTMVK